MASSYCILGLSTFSARAAAALSRSGAQVLVIDHDEAVIQKISGQVAKAVCADVLDREVLNSLHVPDYDVVIVGLRHDFGVAVLAVDYLRKAGIKRIVVQVDSDEEAQAISVVGATDVIFPERDAADRLAKALTVPGLLEQVGLSEDAGIVEVKTPPSFVGKSLIELGIRERYHVHVIGIKSTPAPGGKSRTLIAPPPDVKLRPQDVMLVLGNVKNLTAFTAAIAERTPE